MRKYNKEKYNLIKEEHSNGNFIIHEYDDENRLIKTDGSKMDSCLNEVIRYIYDKNGNKIRKFFEYNGIISRSIKYKYYNNICIENVNTYYKNNKELSVTTTYKYDKNKNLIMKMTDRNECTKYEYNNENKLIKIIFQSDRSNYEILNEYNNNGDISIQYYNNTPSVINKYDENKNLIFEIYYNELSGETNLIGYKYDNKNRKIKQFFYNSKYTENYIYDDNDNLSAIATESGKIFVTFKYELKKEVQ